MADLADIHLRGTRALQPAATTVAAGTLYYVTDEGKTERSSGTSGGPGTIWESYNDTSAAVTASSVTQGATADTNGSASALVDVTGASVTLAAGTWILSGQVMISVSNATFAIAVIADSTNALYSSGQSQQPTAAAGQVLVSIAPIKVVIASSTTFKLRFETSLAGANSIAKQLDTVTSTPCTSIAAIRVA